jgi:MSHA biogenesis protein MshJ
MNLTTLMDQFSKRQMNERRLITIAAVGGTLLLGYSFFIDPPELAATANRNQLTQQEKELADLQTVLPALHKQAGDPDAGLRADIASTKQQIASVDSELQQYQHLLVNPSQMPRLLQDMLARHRGLELVSLKSIAAAPLLPPKKIDTASAPPPNAAMPAQSASTIPAPPPGGIYRHGLEITVAGSYAELVAYAAELQRISPRPLWSGLSLKVVEYPRSELTFTLYTLSLDLPWLAV